MSSSANKSYGIHLILSVTALLHAGNYAVAKLIMPEFLSSFSLITLRLVIAGLLFWVVSFMLPKEVISTKDYKRLILCAFTGGSANILLFFWGLSLTKPSDASLIMTITPVFVLVFSAYFLKEKLSLKKWVGVFIGFSGAILLCGTTFLNTGAYTFWGDFMVFVNALLYGLYLILVKPLAQKYHPVTLFKWICLIGFMFTIPFCFQDIISENWSQLPLKVWGLIFYVCVAATFFTYLLNAFALKHANASIVGVYIYIQPILATFIAIVIGQELFSLTKMVIAIYIFLGVYLVSSKTVDN